MKMITVWERGKEQELSVCRVKVVEDDLENGGRGQAEGHVNFESYTYGLRGGYYGIGSFGFTIDEWDEVTAKVAAHRAARAMLQAHSIGIAPGRPTCDCPESATGHVAGCLVGVDGAV